MSDWRTMSNMPNFQQAMDKAQGCVGRTINDYTPPPAHEEFRDLQSRQLAYIEKLAAERDALREYIAPLQRMLASAEEALRPFVEGASHTMVFLKTRQKMHPVGQELYAEDVERARTFLQEQEKQG